MQILNGAPRDHLTVEQVTNLLVGNQLSVSAGLELLDTDLVLVDEISDDLETGRISWGLHNSIHRSCDLRITRPLRWGIDLVRPYLILSDGSVEARWNIGVFTMETPERQVGETPETYAVQGYDRTLLLDRQIGAAYTVTAGTTYRQALLDVFTAAGLTGALIDSSAADDTLPADRTWSLITEDTTDPDQVDQPKTWRRIINDLLTSINFRAVWADQDGQFRCHAYQAPTDRATEFTFDADDTTVTIVGEDRTLIEDRWKVPNKWVFLNSNVASPTEGAGQYTVVNQNEDELSIDQRGLEWPAVVTYDAATQAKLVELGDRRVANDRRVASALKLRTGPWPGAGHADVYQLNDSAIGSRKVQAVSWAFDLAGGDVEWEWETI